VEIPDDLAEFVTVTQDYDADRPGYRTIVKLNQLTPADFTLYGSGYYFDVHKPLLVSVPLRDIGEDVRSTRGRTLTTAFLLACATRNPDISMVAKHRGQIFSVPIAPDRTIFQIITQFVLEHLFADATVPSAPDSADYIHRVAPSLAHLLLNGNLSTECADLCNRMMTRVMMMFPNALPDLLARATDAAANIYIKASRAASRLECKRVLHMTKQVAEQAVSRDPMRLRLTLVKEGEERGLYHDAVRRFNMSSFVQSRASISTTGLVEFINPRTRLSNMTRMLDSSAAAASLTSVMLSSATGFVRPDSLPSQLSEAVREMLHEAVNDPETKLAVWTVEPTRHVTAATAATATDDRWVAPVAVSIGWGGSSVPPRTSAAVLGTSAAVPPRTSAAVFQTSAAVPPRTMACSWSEMYGPRRKDCCACPSASVLEPSAAVSDLRVSVTPAPPTAPAAPAAPVAPISVPVHTDESHEHPDDAPPAPRPYARPAQIPHDDHDDDDGFACAAR
jgi:hypothetical protein